jgi:dihydropteroate synthase
MGILNVTPDSFSDGGRCMDVETGLRRAEEMIGHGADIIDIGGESTRPGSRRVDVQTELERVAPLIEAISGRFDIPISVDTTKPEVAAAAVDRGAEIINDISGLRWSPEVGEVACNTGAGIILMHSRGDFETMHEQPADPDVIRTVVGGFHRSIESAMSYGLDDDQICLDVGLGFGKTAEQNLELIGKLGTIRTEFAGYPLLIGASRKSFIGKALGSVPVDERLGGSIAAAVIAAMRGANILRVHDVKETAAALKFLAAVENERV